MSEQRAIEASLRAAGLPWRIASTRNLSGGCIHTVLRIVLDDGRAVVAKVNRSDQVSLFEEEAAGLRALHDTGTVIVPQPLAVGAYEGRAVLLMSEVAPGRGDDDAWRRFGGELAALHASEAGERYGFDADNHLGSTFQPNTFCDDWVEFNARYRLGFQVELAQQNGLLHAGELARLANIIDGLDRLIPRRPRPSLLHGDLWSGNAMPTTDETGQARIAVIDPACHVGDGWADIAMMRLFGGFSGSCFAAYAEANTDHDRVEQRIAVYQLYHLLNHVNLFGRGYAGQAMAVAGTLGV